MDEKFEYEKPENTIWGFIIGAGFIIWGVYSLIEMLQDGWGVPWWSLIAWGIGGSMIASNIKKITQRSKILNLVASAMTNHERISIGELSNETNVKAKSLKLVLADLRLKGRLNYTFDKETGDILNVGIQAVRETKVEPAEESIQEQGAAREKIEQAGFGYCTFCGDPITSSTQRYCNGCGSKL
ncbi:MAG: hypothetical protein ACFFCS_04995 [Candidatus Hodarchaeota archaeon]